MPIGGFHDSGEQARKAKKDADRAYTKAVLDIQQLMDAARVRGRIQPSMLEQQCNGILKIYQTCNHSLLFESLNVVRLNKDYLRHHLVNVALLNALIGSTLNLAPSSIATVIKIGLVHDLGMMLLSPDILNSSEKLTLEQLESIRTHPQLSVKLLEDSGIHDEKLIQSVLMHHEKYNGTGYPKGLMGNAILSEAQVTSISDNYDAAVSRKNYKRQKSPFELLQELALEAGGSLSRDLTQRAVSGLALLLVGRWVTMSDMSVGKVVDIDPVNLTYPVVRVVGRNIRSTPQYYPVSISGFMPLHD